MRKMAAITTFHEKVSTQKSSYMFLIVSSMLHMHNEQMQ